MLHPLTQYRQTHSLTLEFLAKKLGIGRAALWKWEHGKIPSNKVLLVEGVTGLSRHVLRPDLYRPLDPRSSPNHIDDSGEAL